MDTLNSPRQADGRPQSLRCPDCGALNPSDSQWCGQCLRRFGPPPPPPGPGPGAPSPAAPSSPPPAPTPDPRPDVAVPRLPAPSTPDVTDDPGPTEAVQRGAFKVEGDRMSWTCRLCENENDLAVSVCGVCGAGFAQTVSPPQQRVIERDPGTVTLMSLFLPGAGHAYLGLWGQAIARGVTSLWVALMTFMLAVQGGPGSPGALVFTLVSFALWAVTAHDAYREATLDSGSALLKDRWFMYVVLGLLLLSFVMIFSAAMAARG